MKLEITENCNKIIYDRITCYMCDGTGQTTVYDLCPNHNKPVGRGKACPHCGAKNKHSHQTVGNHKEKCNYCRGKGERMETKFDNLTKEIFNSLPFKFVGKQAQTGKYIETLYGLGIVGGATDYGQMQRFLKENGGEKTIEKIKQDWYPRQVIQFENKMERFADEILISIYDNGYSLYPNWNLK